MKFVQVNHTGTVDVSFPARTVTMSITRAEYDLIYMLRDHKVTCIKFIRQQYGHDLWSAKQIVDTIHEVHQL